MDTSKQWNEYVSSAIEKHSDTVRRVCFMYLRNTSDVEDTFQEVFIRLYKRMEPFDSEEHEKAWLIRVAINTSKDCLKTFWKKRIDLKEIIEVPFQKPEETKVIQYVLSLSPKYRDVIYLHYYEGYTVPEMAAILKKKENTIYSLLRRAKILLKEEMEGLQDE